MKHFTHIVVLIMLFLGQFSCSAQSNNSPLHYTGNEAYIKQKVAEMLAAGPSVEDTGLKRQNPSAFWLLDRMTSMSNLVNSADDMWAWAIAMDTCVKEYNARLGRKTGSTEQAMLAIEELIQPLFDSGIASNMLSANYMLIDINQYRALDSYLQLISSIRKNCENAGQIEKLCYQEFCTWLTLNKNASSIEQNYIESKTLLEQGMLPASMFSIVTACIHSNIIARYRERTELLKLEKEIITHGLSNDKYKGETLSEHQFEALFNSYRAILSLKIANIEKELSDFGYDAQMISSTKEHVKSQVETLVKSVGYYKNALREWSAIREQIAAVLPQEKQSAYREATKQMYAKFYKQFNDTLKSDMF